MTMMLSLYKRFVTTTRYQITSYMERYYNPFFFQQQQQIQFPLVVAGYDNATTISGIMNHPSELSSESSSSESSFLHDLLFNNHNGIVYMAVPKSKVTRSKKRMKTTVQKRIPMKQNITLDPRTGEITLQHKLPFNWKDYLVQPPPILPKP